MIRRLSVASVLLLLWLGLPLWASAAPVVLFDEGHGQRFLVGGDGPLDLSALASQFVAAGWAITTTDQPLSAERLAAADALVISGPFQPLSAAEVDAVAAFVDGGGRLALMLHIAPPLGPLLHRLEVDYSNGTLRETVNVIAANPLDFRINDLATHPLNQGLASFNIYGAWALRGTAPQARIIASTSPRAWVDLNRDQRLSPGDAVQTFGVVVAGELGAGRFVAFADDALFQNRFLLGGNLVLARNLAGWLAPALP